jgi:uncharacterized Rmd1/YagE family protein
VLDLVALVLAQSASMDFYSKDIAEIEQLTVGIAAGLRTRGRIPRRGRELMRFIGLCMATRNEVMTTLALLDKPDATWEHEELDRLWSGLYHMLELGDRYRTLETKLRMFQDNLVLLTELSRQSSTFVLEIMVVLLILGELIMSVAQMVGRGGHT